MFIKYLNKESIQTKRHLAYVLPVDLSLKIALNLTKVWLSLKIEKYF